MKKITAQVLTSDKTTSPCFSCIFYLGMNYSNIPPKTKTLCAVYEDANSRLECNSGLFMSVKFKKDVNIFV